MSIVNRNSLIVKRRIHTVNALQTTQRQASALQNNLTQETHLLIHSFFLTSTSTLTYLFATCHRQTAVFFFSPSLNPSHQGREIKIKLRRGKPLHSKFSLFSFISLFSFLPPANGFRLSLPLILYFYLFCI